MSFHVKMLLFQVKIYQNLVLTGLNLSNFRFKGLSFPKITVDHVKLLLFQG